MATTTRTGLGIHLADSRYLALALATDGVDDLGTIPAAVGVRDGGVVVGDDAVALAAASPASACHGFLGDLGMSSPKIVGGVPYGVDALVAQLIRAIYDGATQERDAEPSRTAIAHPDALSPYELDVLEHAVRMAGIGETIFVGEAAALDASGSSTASVGAAMLARGDDEQRATRTVPALPKAGRVALLGLPAAAAGGVIGTSGAGGAGGSTLGDFATRQGSTLGDFAAKEGSSLGDFAARGGASIGDFADAPTKSMKDFASHTTESEAKTAQSSATRPAPPRARRIPRVPAAAGAAAVVAAVAVGAFVAIRDSSSEAPSTDVAAPTTTEAPAEDEGPGRAGDVPFLLAGNGENKPGAGNGGAANQASFGDPIAAVSGVGGLVYIADRADGTVRIVTPEGGDERSGVPAGNIDSYADGFDKIRAMTMAVDGALVVADDRGIFRLGSVRDEDYEKISDRDDVVALSPLGNDIAIATADGTVVVRDSNGTEKTVAGGGSTSPAIEGVEPLDADLGTITAIGEARGPNLYIATDESVLLLDVDDEVKLVAGGGSETLAGGEPTGEEVIGAFKARVSPLGVTSDPNGVEATFVDGRGVYRVGLDGAIETLYASGGEVGEFEPTSVYLRAAQPIVVAEREKRVVRLLPAPEAYVPAGPVGRIGRLDRPADYGATTANNEHANASLRMSLPASTADVVVVECIGGEPTREQWDTVIGSRSLPPGVTTEGIAGDGRFLGVVNSRGLLLNDSTGDLPPIGSAVNVTLVWRYDDSYDPSGKSLCMSIVLDDGTVQESTHPAPPNEVWFPT